MSAAREIGSLRSPADASCLPRGLFVCVAVAVLSTSCEERGRSDPELTRRLFAREGVFHLEEVFPNPDWDLFCWTLEYARSSASIEGAKETFPQMPQGRYRYIPRRYSQIDSDRILSLVDFETQTVTSHIVGPKAWFSFGGGADFCYLREDAIVENKKTGSFRGEPSYYISFVDEGEAVDEPPSATSEN